MAAHQPNSLFGAAPNRRNILALDGGGVRGLSSLLILRKLLNRVEVHIRDLTGESISLRPHDIFSLAIGTSTGGLIALMIGKLGLSVDQCIDEYCELAPVIFKEGRPLVGKITHGLYWKEKYSHTVFVREIENLCRKYNRDANEVMTTTALRPDTEYAHSAVVCRQRVFLANGDPHLIAEGILICSHPCKTAFNNCTICAAARATTAAPTYFQAQRIRQDRNTVIELIDGGIEYSNPTAVAWDHYKHHKHTELNWAGSRLISIGTGGFDPRDPDAAPPPRKFLQRLMPTALRLARKAVTDTNTAARNMNLMASLDDIDYHRFTATTGVCWIGMDDYKKLKEIRSLTTDYLRNRKTVKDINDCAKKIARDYVRGREQQRGNGIA